MVLNFSFLELGQGALSQGHAWVTAAVARAHGVIDKAAGGWSAMLRLFLERLMVGPEGLSTAGFPLTVEGRSLLVFGKLANILADGDGLRQALDWRGASGLKPCFKHYNVFKGWLTSSFLPQPVLGRIFRQHCLPFTVCDG